MNKDKTKYVAFHYTDVNVDFDYMGVKRDEFSFANGEDCLYEGGKIYSQDTRIEDNERILSSYLIPERFIEVAKDTGELIQILHDNAHDHLMDKYGFFSEGYDLELLTQEDVDKILTDKKYRRTFGTAFDSHRTEIQDKFYDLKYDLSMSADFSNGRNGVDKKYTIQKELIKDLINLANDLDARLDRQYEIKKMQYKEKEIA